MFEDYRGVHFRVEDQLEAREVIEGVVQEAGVLRFGLDQALIELLESFLMQIK